MQMPIPPSIPKSTANNSEKMAELQESPAHPIQSWMSNRSGNRDVSRKEMFYEGLYVDGLLRKKRKVENSMVRAIEKEEEELAKCTF